MFLKGDVSCLQQEVEVTYRPLQTHLTSDLLMMEVPFMSVISVDLVHVSCLFAATSVAQ